MVSSQVIAFLNEVTNSTRSVQPSNEEKTGPDFKDFPEMNDFDSVQMQLLNAGPKLRRTSQARKIFLNFSNSGTK